MNTYVIYALKGGEPTTVKALTEHQALLKYAKVNYDREWVVRDNCICNPISGWNIEYKVEQL
jgi:hypothetical protein